MSFVTARKIFQDEVFVGCFDVSSPINCALINNTPKTAWLVRLPNSALEYSIEFQDPKQASAVKGVWIDQAGQGMLLDGTVEDFVAKCNSCCGEDSEVTPIYDGVYPSVEGPALKTYTVQQTNNGTIIADQDALYAYMEAAVPGTFSRSSRNNGTGVTTYTFQAYEDPRPQGTDTITQTALLFTSNVPAALQASEQYHFELSADGVTIGTGINAASVAALVTALTADPAYSEKGTYTVSAGAVRLSSTNTDYATLLITVIPV